MSGERVTDGVRLDEPLNLMLTLGDGDEELFILNGDEDGDGDPSGLELALGDVDADEL